MDARVTIVTDLGFGDAGKGSVVDYLARRTPDPTLVVRFNGGSQAAHNVLTPDGRHHTFQQLGSASFVPGSRTHLSRFMLVNPLKLWQEAAELVRLGRRDILTSLTIDEGALIITPYHQAAGQLRELLRGDSRHGSCGEGIGETMADSLGQPDDALHARDLLRPDVAFKKLELARLRKLAELADQAVAAAGSADVSGALAVLQDDGLSRDVTAFYEHFTAYVRLVPGDHLRDLLQLHQQTVFEGAQGVLLDEWYGFHPFTTWSTITNANAEQLLAEAGHDGPATRLGLLRAYATRHGAGPFVTEDARLTAELPDVHNRHNAWQQSFRVGYFDAVAARYALDVAGHIDGLVITNLDRLQGQSNWQLATSYRHPDAPAAFGGRATTSRLVRSPAPDLAYQQSLTDALLAATPGYEPCAAEPFTAAHHEPYLARIEQLLDQPVVLTSGGPSAHHKTPR